MLKNGLAVIVLAGALGAAACGGRSTVATPGAVTRTVVLESTEGVGMINLSSVPNVQHVLLQAPLPRVWSTLPTVYEGLGLPFTMVDARTHLLGSMEQRVRRIGGRGLEAFFDCPGAMENLAATGEVYVTVRTQLLPQGDSATQALTEIAAHARARTGGQDVTCSSSGRLESLLRQRLLAAADSTAR